MQPLSSPNTGKLIRVLFRRALVAFLIPVIVLSSLVSMPLAQAAQAQNAAPSPASNPPSTGHLEDLSGIPSQIDAITRDPGLYTPADNIADAIKNTMSDAGMDTGDWRWRPNSDGSVTLTSTWGSKVTGRLDGAGHIIITKTPGIVLPDAGPGTLDFSGHPGAIHKGESGAAPQAAQPNGQAGITVNGATYRPQDFQQLAVNRALE